MDWDTPTSLVVVFLIVQAVFLATLDIWHVTIVESLWALATQLLSIEQKTHWAIGNSSLTPIVVGVVVFSRLAVIFTNFCIGLIFLVYLAFPASS